VGLAIPPYLHTGAHEGRGRGVGEVVDTQPTSLAALTTHEGVTDARGASELVLHEVCTTHERSKWTGVVRSTHHAERVLSSGRET